MDGQEQSDTGDEIDAEVSDVRLPAGASSASPSHALLQTRLTPRRWFVRLTIILSTGVLALVVVLGSIPAVRDRFFPPPTPTLPSGSDLFYLLPNPPGVEVSLDGHTLAHLPFPGDAHPLRLAPGHHILAWQSHGFPFLPQKCSVSVPSSPTDTCPLLGADTLHLPPHLPTLGQVIALHASLNTLPANARSQLAAAVQGALNASQSTALVQPGEQYFSTPPGIAVVATQPLHALLSFARIGSLFPGGPCEPSDPALPCRFPAQDCTQLCTVVQPPSPVAPAPGEWIAAALVGSLWRYTLLGGQVVGDHLPDAFDTELAVLRITWDGAAWHVTVLLGYTPGLPATDDSVCTPARYWLEHNGRWAFMMADGHPGTAQFVSDTTPTDGCLVVLDPHPGTDVPAVFLERFGVLLAVNQAANGVGADLPMVDAAEKSLAHRLAVHLQLTL
jgi:hypothetical protein